MKNKIIYIILILLIIILLLCLISYPKNCKNNIECFTKASLKCSKAKLNYIIGGNSYTYTIKGKRKDKCTVTVFFNKAADMTDPNLKALLENKGMFCEIPRELIQGPIFEIPNLNNYCTGPLKEAHMHITIEKMYSIIIKNVGQISSEMKKAIERA